MPQSYTTHARLIEMRERETSPCYYKQHKCPTTRTRRVYYDHTNHIISKFFAQNAGKIYWHKISLCSAHIYFSLVCIGWHFPATKSRFSWNLLFIPTDFDVCLHWHFYSCCCRWSSVRRLNTMQSTYMYYARNRHHYSHCYYVPRIFTLLVLPFMCDMSTIVF